MKKILTLFLGLALTLTLGACNTNIEEECEHEWGEELILTVPNCTQEGLAEKTCLICGEVQEYTLPIDPDNHDFLETYSTNEDSHWYECSRCGAQKDKEDHTYISYTPIEGGLYHTATCSCGYQKIELHHALSATNPTCVCGESNLNVSGLAYEYDIEYNGYYVSGYISDDSEALFIPEEYTGTEGTYPVIGTKSASSNSAALFYNNTTLKYVSLPETLVYLGNRTFFGCSALVDASLPDGLESLGNFTFRLCSNLTSAYIPSSVETIGYGVYAGAASIRNITVSLNNKNYYSEDNGIYTEKDNEVTLVSGFTDTKVKDNTTILYDYAFAYFDQMTEITLPSTIKEIGSDAFYHCEALETLEFPSSLKTIGTEAFASCLKLDGITLPEGLETISTYAFSSCSSLSSINIPSTVTEIGDYGFATCTALAEITFSENSQLEKIGGNAFWMVAVTGLDLPEGVTYIDMMIATECPNLEWVVIPSSVTYLGYGAFGANTKLKTLYYGGASKTEWDAIEMGTTVYDMGYNDYLTSCTMLYYSETSASNCWHYVNGVPTSW